MTDSRAAVASRGRGGGADLVIETTGTAAGISLAIASARRSGRIVCLGLGDGATVPVPMDDAMTRSISRCPRSTPPGTALALMAADVFDPAAITTVHSLERYQRAFGDLARRAIVKALLAPRP